MEHTYKIVSIFGFASKYLQVTHLAGASRPGPIRMDMKGKVKGKKRKEKKRRTEKGNEKAKSEARIIEIYAASFAPRKYSRYQEKY